MMPMRVRRVDTAAVVDVVAGKETDCTLRWPVGERATDRGCCSSAGGTSRGTAADHNTLNPHPLQLLSNRTLLLTLEYGDAMTQATDDPNTNHCHYHLHCE